MDNNTSTYRPVSPDLSGFLPQPEPPTRSQLQYSTSHLKIDTQAQSQAQTSQSYTPVSPVIPSFSQLYEQSRLQNAYQTPRSGSVSAVGGEYGDYHGRSALYMPPIPPLPPAHSFAPQPHSHTPTASYQPNHSQPATTQPAIPYQVSHYYPHDSEITPPHFSTVQQNHNQNDYTMADAAVYKDPNPDNIEIKTKFPVARIKRIMQADEDVGKVAQVTPVAVNKALELFMIALVTGSAEKAREKGGKRITAQHLKAVVEGEGRWDFLKEIVERVADVQENAGGEGRKRKAKKEETESDSEAEEKKAKKGKGGRRKKAD